MEEESEGKAVVLIEGRVQSKSQGAEVEEEEGGKMEEGLFLFLAEILWGFGLRWEELIVVEGGGELELKCKKGISVSPVGWELAERGSETDGSL